MKHFFTFLSIPVILAGCSLIPDDRYEFTGSWQWIQSQGGFAGITMTPETEGYEEQLVFFGGRFYIIMRDEDIFHKGEYTVNPRTFSGIKTPAIGFEHQHYVMDHCQMPRNLGLGCVVPKTICSMY